ncbi:ExbD/TolR family protein [Paraburkholderia sediminicola]|uniref:ExbD/TolR family protein n=1 Tax=Paraburkholderia sediminicola TaxID=458836 RepID=UPI0038BD9891
MAMNSQQMGSDLEPMVDINTTPLIDVMLVLLIMLIITIPIQNHAVKMNLPSATPPVALTPPPTVHVDVASDGAVRWDGQVVTGQADLDARLGHLSAMQEQPELDLKADRAVEYRYVAAVMAAAERLGVTKLALVSDGSS